MDIKKDLIELLVEARVNLPDEKAVKFKAMYPHWKAEYEDEQGEKHPMKYEKGQRIQHDDVLWRVIDTHTVDDPENWKPGIAHSLYTKVLIPDETQIYPWEQPESTNPYKEGDMVTHNGKTWVSKHPANIWEPGAIGAEALWAEVV